MVWWSSPPALCLPMASIGFCWSALFSRLCCPEPAGAELRKGKGYVYLKQAFSGLSGWVRAPEIHHRRCFLDAPKPPAPLRMRVVYDHLPHAVYDVLCPDVTLSVGTTNVWAYGTELWRIQSVGGASPNARDKDIGHRGLGTPILLIILSVLIPLWYFFGVKTVFSAKKTET